MKIENYRIFNIINFANKVNGMIDGLESLHNERFSEGSNNLKKTLVINLH